MLDQTLKTIFNIFWKGVQSVHMSSVMKKNLIYDKTKDSLSICNITHQLKNKDVHVVGAGKAVFHMAVEIEKVLGRRIKSGIISVPIGITDKGNPLTNSTIECHEGAKNNLPDVLAERTTNKIIQLLKGLDESSCLIVLLSGGGSALLSSPLNPITLTEKCDLIGKLSKAGADIIELNTVRKKISNVKGGKLSCLAHPAEVVTLLISDIMISHEFSHDFIASGPTYRNNDSSSSAFDVVVKYGLENSIPRSIEEALKAPLTDSLCPDLIVSNYVLADNTTAVKAAQTEASNLGYLSLILSYCVNRNVSVVSEEYCKLASLIVNYLSNVIGTDEIKNELKAFEVALIDEFLDKIETLRLSTNYEGICLIAGGEPIVNVTGNGRGGRSQQLALNFSIDFDRIKKTNTLLNQFDVYLLCAGTDGIDGPTDAAGAVGYNELVKAAENEGLNPVDYSKRNDSYNFFDKFQNGKFHIKTGHTNTNVMDVHVMVIKRKIFD